jgi:flagellar basal body-associated protein FliL
MSEETQDKGWSGLKKTIIGTLTTLITAGGAYVGTTLFGGSHEEHKEEVKTEQTAPTTNAAAPAPVIINVQQNQENKQQVKQSGGTNTIIKEKVIEKPAKAEPAKEEEPW